MNRRRMRVLTAVPAIAALAVTGTVATAGAAGAAPAVTSGASTATANLLGTLAYRGAEHPYLVGNVADAVKRFGPGSAQANAAQAGLNTNVHALAVALAQGSSSVAATIAGQLGQRDRVELSFAAAVVKAKAAGTTALTPAEKQTTSTLAAGAKTMAKSLHSLTPNLSYSDALKALTKLNAGDLAALRAAALNAPTQFGLVETASKSLAVTLIGVGADEAATKKLSGTAVDSNGDFTIGDAATYRASLETAFVEHVYQTGLFGMAILRNGPRSAATVAARKAEDANTKLVAQLLGDIGTGTGHTQAVWNTHITGYGDYLTGLYAGQTALTKPASTLLTSYEAAITALVKKQTPGLGTSTLRASYTEHVDGTLVVFRLEKANSAQLYPTALMGGMHFADLATSIAKGQDKIKG